ncbi:hypothetical protein KM043_007632 [Ampulex compressa]|nr:hypothetical protein KM043_007632 [Ampulex compressa]
MNLAFCIFKETQEVDRKKASARAAAQRERPATAQDATRCHSCQCCGKSFTRASFLQAHLDYRCYWNPQSQQYKSGKVSRFSCTICGASYTRQNNLMWHVRHECGKPQKCTHCGKTFLHRTSLYKHKSRYCPFRHIVEKLTKSEPDDMTVLEMDPSMKSELILDPLDF